jgi:hypothetical protein
MARPVSALLRHHMSAPHDDVRRLAEDWDDWAARAEPLALTPVLKVDTSRSINLDSLVLGPPLSSAR